MCVCSRPTRHNSTVLFTKLHSSHTGRHRSGEKLVKLSNFSVCGSGSRNRSKDSSTLRDGAFFNKFAHISDRHENITTHASSHQNVFLIFRNSSAFRIHTPDADSGPGSEMKMSTSMLVSFFVWLCVCVSLFALCRSLVRPIDFDRVLNIQYHILFVYMTFDVDLIPASPCLSVRLLATLRKNY